MAATGGGKIRSRRYHIASKPYAKNKQQSGLISRVTDTVKSIVPSWLQKYFKNEDDPQGEEVVQGTEQNSQPPPPNGSEEGLPPINGRDSPEPSTSNTACPPLVSPSCSEPSASRASLNFQDYVLSRPPLNRSHLHFPPLDVSSPVLGASSSLFSQPSTSSAPGPFATGFSLVKEIKDNLSQHEDDNISTTSGFSSRASDKDVPASKTASIPQLWSPEMDRTISGPQPAHSSLKRPAFNLSVFGTSSNSSLNSSLLNSRQLGDSPFYPGKTAYGGAAAVRSSRTRPGVPYQAPVRRQIKAKPAGAQPCGLTSATARRVLQSLERMSSPLADAKRIPAAASSPLSASLDGNLELSHFQLKKKRLDSTLPPVQRLVIPTAASVSGNRSVSFRPSLTPGGLSRALDKTPRHTPTRQSPQLPEPTAATPCQSQSTFGSGGSVYPLSSTPAASSSSSGGFKMKRERTSTRPSSKRPKEDEVAEVLDLPAVTLPISTSSLPTFSFSPLPPRPTSVTVNSAPNTLPVTPAKETVSAKEPTTASTPPSEPFTFASPIVKATAASPPAFSPSAGFTFSAPVAKLGPSMSNGKLITPTGASVKLMSNSINVFDGPFKPAKVQQGSVLDLLKTPGFCSPIARSSPSPDTAPQQTTTQSTATFSTSTMSSLPSEGFGNLFKPPAGSWECDTCLVQNKSSDSKCVACSTPKPNSSSTEPSDNKPTTATSAVLESNSTFTTTTTTTTGFGTMFAKPAGTWDCDTCLVQNKPEVVKCMACETAKPGTGLKPSLTLPSAFTPAKTVSTPTLPVSTGFIGFGDKFKKPEGAWECDTCMLQNKAEDTKCAACTSPKPGASLAVSSAPDLGLGDKFKKPESSWDCEVCLLQNKAADLQCIACQAAKPGAKVEPKGLASSFGNSGSSASASGGFKFGLSDSSSSGSGGFKFGVSDSEASSASSSSGGFKFGGSFGSSTSEATTKDTTTSSGFKFGSSTEGFKLGSASTLATDSNETKSEQPAPASGFQFGTIRGTFGAGTSSTENNASLGGFKFGLPKTDEKTSETSISSSSVTFTPPAPSQETNDGAALSNNTTSSNSTTTTTAGSVFSRLGERSSTTTTTPGSSTFGSLSAEKEPAAPVFSFGKPEEKKEAAAPSSQSNFLFSAANREDEPAPAPLGTFSFSKPNAPKEEPAAPTFSFGKPADMSNPSPADDPKPSFTFGQSATDSAAAAPKPAFPFMAGNAATATTTTTSSSSSSTPPPSLFGGSTQAPAPAVAPSSFLFGQAAGASSDAFLFGQSQESQPPAPAASLNSAPPATLNSTPAPPQSQPFIFGAPTSVVPAAAAAAAPPSFGFGTAATPSAVSSAAPSPAPTPFAFGSAPSGGFGASQTPSFGSGFGSPFSATPSQAPAFGAKPNATPFGQQTNSTTGFGASANAAPGGGFQFGGASGFGTPSNSTGVFTFGAGAVASPAPSAGSSFTPQPAAPGGGFNFSQTPSFNIGSAKSAVPSPAGQQMIPGRKIKTAVRRRK
ncbi:nuclear pore complex protein Nup153 isoform X3 [Genypterus blacodes]|uniref:nuclear pore complex protein Nup153 isoform X3 n=1 Tax=Genypterus blacodes TaxID=154954 RepID=UPI003F75A6DA